MALEHNNSNDQVLSTPKYYVGLCNVKVLAVNPSKKELEGFGINLKDEPQYIGVTVGDRTLNKVVFYVKSSDSEPFDLITRVEILVDPEQRTSQNGNLQWVNPFGATAWGDSVDAIKANPKMEWFFKNTENQPFQARPAFGGEEILLNFLRAWANVKTDSVVYFDDPAAIASGNVKELKQYVKSLKDNEVRILLGVKANDDRTKFYQVVYMGHFERIFRDKQRYFLTALNKEYGGFNAIYDANDLTLKEATDELLMADPEEATAEQGQAASGSIF